VDALIQPGAITEIVGSPSSGRTSLFLACVRVATAGGGVVALVDTDETFDPASAARAGIDLRRVLWVRCAHRRHVALRATDVLVRCPGFAVVGLDAGDTPPPLPLTAGFRWAQAARRTGVALVIVGGRRIAGPSTRVAVQTVQETLAWEGPARTPTRLAGVRTALHPLRTQGAHRVAGGEAASRWWTA
jgi:hypothetical protein